MTLRLAQCRIARQGAGPFLAAVAPAADAARGPLSAHRGRCVRYRTEPATPLRHDASPPRPACEAVRPDLAAAPAPTTLRALEADRERHWQALLARLDRTEREITTLLAAIRTRTAAAGPQQQACPTPLELATLEAIRIRREGIEREMQILLGELGEHR